MSNKKKAKKIVEAVLKDLSGRSGIGNEIENCDNEIREEIDSELTQIVADILDEKE